MTVKSIVDIEVNSAEFARFQELFGKYQEQLAKTPSAWAQVSDEQKAVSSNFEKMAAAMMAQSQLRHEISEDEAKQEKHLTLSERLWTSMARSTKSVAGNIAHATEALLKWSGIIGAVSGLLGAGGLWGIDRMAERVSDQRRSAQGLGLSIGEQKAFGLNFGRIVDPDAFLGWLNTMETDISKQGPAFSLTGHKLSGNTGEDAISMLQAVRGLAKRTDLNKLGPILSGYGLNLDPEQQRRLHSGSDSEFNQLLSGYRRDKTGLDLPPGVAKEWQDFTTQMQRASGQIFKTFVEGLAPLAPALSRLSEGFEKFISTLLKSDLAKDAIAKVATWFEEFSGKIASPEFLDKVKQFTSDMGALSDALHKLAHPFETAGSALADHIGDRVSQGDREGYEGYLKGQAAQFGVPAALLDAQWKLESDRSFNGKMVNPKSGATGVFQFLPSTAKDLGIDPTDVFQSGYGAAKYDSQLLKKYHGDIADVLAAYNMGTGNFDKVRGQHPNDWINYVSPETKNYVAQGTKMTGGPGVLINVNNNTGGSASVSVSQLAPWGAVH